MKPNVMQALMPKKYYDLLLEQEKVRSNARDLNHHREYVVNECEGNTVSVNLEGTVCLVTITLLPNKNLLDLSPKIEFKITGAESKYSCFLSQLVNECIQVDYNQKSASKVKIVIIAHVLSNNGNIESAIVHALPKLIEKFSASLDSQMSDIDVPFAITQFLPPKPIKVGLVFKQKK